MGFFSILPWTPQSGFSVGKHRVPNSGSFSRRGSGFSAASAANAATVTQSAAGSQDDDQQATHRVIGCDHANGRATSDPRLAPAEEQHQRDDKADDEKDPRNVGCDTGDTAKAQHTGYEPDDQEH
jgi:hypothetical protein